MSALSLRSGNVNLYKFNQWSVADLMPFRIRQRSTRLNLRPQTSCNSSRKFGDVPDDLSAL
jgi:hypothetical protein